MEKKKCKVEVYARVTGFMRPVQDWNKGKTAEFKDRLTYDAFEAEKKAAIKKKKEEEVVDIEKPASFDKTEMYPPQGKEG